MPSTQNDLASGKPVHQSQYSPSYSAMPIPTNAAQSSSSSFSQALTSTRSQDGSKASPFTHATSSISQVQSHPIGGEPSYYLGISSSYPESNARASAVTQSGYNHIPSTQTPQYTYPMASATDPHVNSAHMGSRPSEMQPSMNHAGGMMIESHDVDMNTLQQQESFPFSTGEILPWLEYLPQDVLSFFGESQNFPMMSPGETTPRPTQ